MHACARRRDVLTALWLLLSIALLPLAGVTPARSRADTGLATGTTGAWTPTGTMATARQYQTATLLPSGQVLVAGGCAQVHCQPTLASAELYDPATGSWTTTGSMGTPRLGHTATLLTTGPDSGDVLVAGGSDYEASYTAYLNSAELYNPATGTWSATGAMHGIRSNFTATRLADGRVLVAGGINSCCSGPSLATVEIYDPSTGTWATTGDMTTPRQFQTATLLPSGKVLVTGGCADYTCATILASAEVYDPSTGVWTAIPSMSTSRMNHTATLLPNDTVLVAGGCTDGACLSALASAEVYDPQANTWTMTGSMATARSQFTATLLATGQVLAAGGCGSSCALASTELYDPSSGTWEPAASMATARGIHTATLLTNGQVLVAGGISSVSMVVLASAELYNPDLTPASPTSVPASPTATPVPPTITPPFPTATSPVPTVPPLHQRRCLPRSRLRCPHPSLRPCRLRRPYCPDPLLPLADDVQG